jgi:hypothetical protein
MVPQRTDSCWLYGCIHFDMGGVSLDKRGYEPRVSAVERKATMTLPSQVTHIPARLEQIVFPFSPDPGILQNVPNKSAAFVLNVIS